MRQIGVRDEAKLLADYGDCGKPVCCNTHMIVMPPCQHADGQAAEVVRLATDFCNFAIRIETAGRTMRCVLQQTGLPQSP